MSDLCVYDVQLSATKMYPKQLLIIDVCMCWITGIPTMCGLHT